MLQTLDLQEGLENIQSKGYIEINNLFSQEMLKQVNEAIKIPFERPSINGSKGYIKKDNIRFLFCSLSWRTKSHSWNVRTRTRSVG